MAVNEQDTDRTPNEPARGHTLRVTERTSNWTLARSFRTSLDVPRTGAGHRGVSDAPGLQPGALSRCARGVAPPFRAATLLAPPRARSDERLVVGKVVTLSDLAKTTVGSQPFSRTHLQRRS
jgi:hypothetical protein